MSLQEVTHCPACESPRRSLLHADVPDFVFHASDERWTVMRCDECGSLYLKQRPSPNDIGQYYQRYYTHVQAPDSAAISGIAVRSSALKRLANSWRNTRYGTRRPSFGRAGAIAMLLLAPLRSWIDAESRHLPEPRSRGTGFSVLDIGCGDARFVRFAQEAGCCSVGLEIDPVAVAAAQRAGLNVHAGDASHALAVFGAESFDYVTMSHVIEHLHDPRQTLGHIYQLLKPGGILWLETPNPESYGHTIYGDRWRDLDPPRHLCVMSDRAIRILGGTAGFEVLTEHHRPFVPFEVFPFSSAARGIASKSSESRWRLRVRCAFYELLGQLMPSRREWITLQLIRPRPSAAY